MTHYFIDGENVGMRFTDIVKRLGSGDEILFFYTENNQNTGIPVSVIDEITRKDATFKAVRCFAGSNALDFQLVSYLGYAAAKSSGDVFIICSDDGGYDPVVQFWKERGLPVSRVSSEGHEAKDEKPVKQRRKRTAPHPAAPEPAPPTAGRSDCLKTYSQKLLDRGIDEKYVPHIAGVIYRGITLPKKGRNLRIQTQIRKICGKEHATDIFTLTKPVIEQIDREGPLPVAQTQQKQ